MSAEAQDDAKDLELDPSLERWLREARDGSVDDLEGPEGAGPGEPAFEMQGVLDSVLQDVEQEIAEADKSPLFRLRSQPTTTRRIIAGAAALLIVVLGGMTGLRADFSTYPAWHMALSLISLGGLLAFCLHQALRPLHQPSLPPWSRSLAVGMTLLTPLLLALTPPGADAGFLANGLSVDPCLLFGLSVGFPIYLVLRLLDRGGRLGPLLASCGAGLVGNMVLQLHCASLDAGHLLASHFGVILVFEAGLALVHRLESMLRNRQVTT